jgi:hypothetical protein
LMELKSPLCRYRNLLKLRGFDKFHSARNTTLAIMVALAMRDLLILATQLLVTLASLVRPCGARSVAAESLLLKHPLLITNRSRQRTPNLTTLNRVMHGLTTLFLSPRRIAKLGTLTKPATLLN